MSDFTYEIPDSEKYFKGIIAYLKRESKDKLVELLQSAKCSISDNGQFSRQRWMAHWTEVIFHISLDKFNQIDDYIGGNDKNILIRICDTIMPKDAGLDVMNVDFVPDLNVDDIPRGLEDDIIEINASLKKRSATFSLPDDVLAKGQEMAEVYLYLYAVENYIRIFIEKVSISHYGSNYIGKLNVPRSVRDSINLRKQQESKNRWISIRGSSELFYLDFKELGTLMSNNWSLFKQYFPDQSWINSKIDELGNCRNLVAHNSYISNHERDVIRINFNSIVRQLNPFIK